MTPTMKRKMFLPTCDWTWRQISKAKEFILYVYKQGSTPKLVHGRKSGI